MKRLRLKSKVAKLKSFFTGNNNHHHHRHHYSRNLYGNTTWMSPITHGSYIVQNGSASDHDDDDQADIHNPVDLDTIVVQREEIGCSEVWFYGLFDPKIGNSIARQVQSQLFDKKPKESQIKDKGKEVITKAYLNATATLIDESDKKSGVGGSASSVLVIGSRRIVIADMGDYRAVVCKNGEAHQLQPKGNQHTRRYWPHRFISGAFRGRKCNNHRSIKSREIAVSAQRIDSSETEFIILASSGVWEVMKSQEAVNLISHIDDAQEAAQCLAKEAFVRKSRSSISCLIIRFD